MGVRWRDSDNIIGPAIQSPCDDSTESCVWVFRFFFVWSHEAIPLRTLASRLTFMMATRFGCIFLSVYFIVIRAQCFTWNMNRMVVVVSSILWSGLCVAYIYIRIVLCVAEADGMFCYWSYKLVMLFVRTKNERQAQFNGIESNEKEIKKGEQNWECFQNWKSTRTNRRHVLVFFFIFFM